MSSRGTPIIALPKLHGRRRYSAKVKTGCRTCKIRRVKCDEQKPECARCLGTGRTCDGYAQENIPISQQLVPRQSSGLARGITTMPGLGDSALYLEFYYHCAGHKLANNFDHQFWSRIVLQMAHSEEAIRHAVIALGSLIKMEPNSNRPSRSASAINNRKTLLQHQNKAVRCLVDRMAQPSYSLEVGLIAGLIFMCIEYIRGDYKAAFIHLHGGLRMISEWQQKHENIAQIDRPTSNSSLKRVTRATDMITENLAPIFNRAITTGLLCGAPFEPILLDFCPDPRSLQPTSFTSVLEAQSVFHDIRNATVIIISVFFRKIVTCQLPTAEDLKQREHLLDCHESWFGALHDLERTSELSKEDMIVVSSVKVWYYSSYIYLAGAIDRQLTGFDEYISSFQALNYHARIVLDSMNLHDPSASTPSATPADSPSSSNGAVRSESPLDTSKSAAAHFTFEISLVPTLFAAATRCRCPATRRESLSLLARNPPREALWDAERAVILATRVIELEEAEIDPTTGRPTYRVRIVNSSVLEDTPEPAGFWASFMSVSWLMGGLRQDDPSRRRGSRVPGAWNSEWEEWFPL